jgi:general stress protein 26
MAAAGRAGQPDATLQRARATRARRTHVGSPQSKPNQGGIAMAKTLSPTEKQKHLTELIEHFHTAMLVTRGPDGGLRSRPLAIAHVQPDGLIVFATSIESGKVHDIEAEPQVNVSLQDARRFVSLSGRASIVRDQALVDALWSDAWKVWFPKGKTDPSICLIQVDATSAEYWDETGGKGIGYLFDAVAAYVKGTRPAPDDDAQNARVKL